MIEIITTPWKRRPENGASTRHRFAIGDIHGHADLLQSLLGHIEALPARGARDIIFTGDIFDRGPENFRALDLALGAAEICDRRIILPGNHEAYMLEAFSGEDDAKHWWGVAGGRSVMAEVDPQDRMSLADQVRAVRERLPDGHEDMLRRSRGWVCEDDLFFVHAGIKNGAMRKEILDSDLIGGARKYGSSHWSLVRSGFLTSTIGWDLNVSGRPWRGPMLVIHGHSIEADAPPISPDDLLRSSDHVEDRRRINIDVGSYKFRTLACVEFRDRSYRLHAVTERL